MNPTLLSCKNYGRKPTLRFGLIITDGLNVDQSILQKGLTLFDKLAVQIDQSSLKEICQSF